MEISLIHKVQVLMLISALMLGQVGAGFLHNEHDAHEAVVDRDSNHPVLLEHGEHCKVCAVDWVHQSDLVFFEFVSPSTGYNFLQPADVTSSRDVRPTLNNDRAPPFLS
jgi:hypothetical protein